MKIRRASLYIFSCFLVIQAAVCVAESDQDRNPYLLGGLLSGRSIKETCIGARLGSYKPSLRELDTLVQPFGVNVPGAATMYNIFVKFRGSPQLSYLLEVDYWANEESIPVDLAASAGSASVGATFTQASISLLYYPEIIRGYVPLYLGIGAGVSHMRFTGGVMEQLLTDREDTGASGNLSAGLEYKVLERMTVYVQAKRIFKSFSVEETEDNQEFSFDGTVLSIGASARF